MTTGLAGLPVRKVVFAFLPHSVERLLPPQLDVLLENTNISERDAEHTFSVHWA